MPKGIYSGCMCVLTTRPIPVQEIDAALGAFEVIGHPPLNAQQAWQFSGPSLVVSYLYTPLGLVAPDYKLIRRMREN